MSITKKQSIPIVITLVFTLSLLAFCAKCTFEKYQENKKLEARFDHFMNILYPYLAEYHNRIVDYVKMQKSIMLCPYKHHLYAYDYVKYYDGSGSFLMRNEIQTDIELNHLSMIFISGKVNGPIDARPSSRDDDYWNYISLIRSKSNLDKYRLTIYDDDVDIDLMFQKLDSISNNAHTKFLSLSRFNTTLDLVDLNSIPEKEYSLESY